MQLQVVNMRFSQIDILNAVVREIHLPTFNYMGINIQPFYIEFALRKVHNTHVMFRIRIRIYSRFGIVLYK